MKIPCLRFTTIILSLSFIIVSFCLATNALAEDFGGDDGLIDHPDYPESKPLQITSTMPTDSISNSDIMEPKQIDPNGKVQGILDDATKAVTEKVGGFMPGNSDNQTSTPDLETKANRAKVLSGKLLSRLTKILAKEEALVTEQKSLGFSSTTLDEKVTKIKQDIDVATQKIELLKIDSNASDTEGEKTRIKSVIADIKSQLQLIKDDEKDLLSSLK